MLSSLIRRPLGAAAPALRVLGLFLLAGGVSAEGPEIARIAPDRAFLVASVPDWPQLRRTVLESNLGRLWAEPRIASLVEEAMKEPSERFTGFLREINADPEDLKHPAGHIGGALFFATDETGEVDTDSEPYFMVVADFGEHADDWGQLIEKYIERGLDSRTLTTQDDEYRDVRITIITPVYVEDPHADCGDECEHKPGLAEAIGGSFEDQRSLTIARVEDSLIFCSDLRSLEGAIERATGGGRRAMADHDVYRDAADQHTRGTLAHAVLVTGPLLEMAFEDMGEEFQQFMTLMGLGEMRAIGGSLRLDTVDAVAEVAFSANMAEKRGIFELIDEPGGAFDPPGFVPQGAGSVSRFSFRFDRLIEVARRIVQGLPDDQRQQAVMMIDQASGMAGPVLDAMGPSVYMVTTYRQPFEADSMQMLYAIDVRDELTVTNTLDFLMGQAGGMLETRDFDGTAIYFSEMMPFELSAAVGFGRIFIGTTPAVENALRAAGQPDAPRIGEEPRFREAIRPLSDRALGYSYTHIGQWLRWMWWSLENSDKMLEQTLDQAGIDGEYKEEILRQSREDTPEWQKNLPPVESITRYIGDMVYELRSEQAGFFGRVLLLKPREAND